jgi:hypothetical protein
MLVFKQLFTILKNAVPFLTTQLVIDGDKSSYENISLKEKKILQDHMDRHLKEKENFLNKK